ncbi:uncharacterized protein LOC131647623 [Vicia villosa]|uniref:uncharacterized protein LOC131647623 n=1 Tax=Vicia villosa TaxID=3911 RepID=UPI00273C1D45|nr:uncharacterized protein LOC131647623 [Vicia villosa]
MEKSKKRQMTKKGHSTTVEEREGMDGTGCTKLDNSSKKQYGPSGSVKDRRSVRKGKEVMVEDEEDDVSISSHVESQEYEAIVMEKEQSWIQEVTKPTTMGTQVLQIPAGVITACNLVGKNNIMLYDTEIQKGYKCVLKKRDGKNEMFLCRGWYEFAKS